MAEYAVSPSAADTGKPSASPLERVVAGDEPAVSSPRLTLAQAILALGEVASAHTADSSFAHSEYEALPRLLEHAAQIVADLLAAPWSFAAAREVREFETVIHVGRVGTSGQTASSDASLVEALAAAKGYVDVAALGVWAGAQASAAAGDSTGAAWVVPFGFEPAGHGWLAVPARASIRRAGEAVARREQTEIH